MNNLQLLRYYPVSKYVIRKEVSYYQDRYDLSDMEITFLRTYKMDKMLYEKILDVKYVIRNSFGKIIYRYI
jgi:hypothetical protein